MSLPVPTSGVKAGCSDITSEPYDTHCSFSCNVGYNLTGSPVRRCLENGTWSGQTSYCQGMINSLLSDDSSGQKHVWNTHRTDRKRLQDNTHTEITLHHSATQNRRTPPNSANISQWTLKDSNIDYSISWNIISSSSSYNSSSKRCILCLREKFLIICRFDNWFSIPSDSIGTC